MIAMQVHFISTKAGSVGINLTAAFRMIIYDELWNPVHNAQAWSIAYAYCDLCMLLVQSHCLCTVETAHAACWLGLPVDTISHPLQLLLKLPFGGFQTIQAQHNNISVDCVFAFNTFHAVTHI